MNHQPSDDSVNVHPSGQAVVERHAPQLNPAIAQALSCLDIKLEDELTRFRSSTQPDPVPQPQLLPVNAVTWEPGNDMYADSDIFTAEIIQPATSNRIAAAKDYIQPHGFVIIDGLTTSPTTSREVATTVSYAPITIYREDAPTRADLDVDFSTGGEIAPFHDEYLSSSQELLRQIQSGYQPTATETFNRTQTAAPTPKTRHFTPLKIGSMAAACVLAGGVVYTALNPNLLTTLTATNVVPTPTTTNLIQTPNLAASEFTELNLSTLNNIKLPTVVAAAPAQNVSIATANFGAMGTAPAPVPFTAIGSQINPPATITAQPRLADSLMKSLLPPNFQVRARATGYRPVPTQIQR